MEDEATIRRTIHRYRRMMQAGLGAANTSIASVMLAVAEADLVLLNERERGEVVRPAQCLPPMSRI